ncbi:MAG TPA: tyrosine-protein phosphatase [Candidatus Limnocylindria bacterium]|nr:tyrosine-protein phosphatase [Candidatus Limnocylindria bacterium]
MGDKGEWMGEFIVIELTATGKGSFAGRTMRVAALLLLFGLLAPSGVSPGPAAAPGNLSSRGVMVGDNSVFRPGNVRVSERLFGLPGLTNIGRVANGIFRGAQPKPEGYATLKAMGVRTVINLRTRHGEKEAVEAAEMRYVEIPMNVWKNVDPAAVRKVLSVMTDLANQPVFVHCSRGADRTGVVAAVYRMEVDGWSEAEAEAEMEAFGFHEVWSQLKEFVRRYKGGAERVPGGDGP